MSKTGVVMVVGVFVLITWYEIAVWGECLQTHSWWYCARILGK